MDQQIEHKDMWIVDIFEYTIPYNCLMQISEYNQNMIKRQINSLNKGISIIKKNALNDTRNHEQKQFQTAIKWCEKYKIPH